MPASSAASSPSTGSLASEPASSPPVSTGPPSTSGAPASVAYESTRPPRAWQPVASRSASTRPHRSERIAHPEHDVPPGPAHGDVGVALHVALDGGGHVPQLAAEREDDPGSQRRRDARLGERP